MRVVDVTQWYGPTSGGIRTYLHAKAAFAHQHGLQHAIVVPGEAPGQSVIHGSALAVVRGRTPTDRWGYRMVIRPDGVIAALERCRPSLVVLHDCFAFPQAIARWARSNRVPLAMVCHSDLTLAADGAPGWARRMVRHALEFVQRRGLAAASFVLMPSQTTARRVAHAVTGETQHVPLGIDLDVFAEATCDPELRHALCGAQTQLLLYAGRLSPEKGVHLLAPTLAELPSAHLVVAGSGPSEEKVRQQISRLGIGERATFLGHVSDRRHLATLMASADCFVHPNAREAFGLAPLEALAAGCRVVAPASEGCAENLGQSGCVLVEPDDPVALARGIERALAGPRPQPNPHERRWEHTFSTEWEIYRRLAAE